MLHNQYVYILTYMIMFSLTYIGPFHLEKVMFWDSKSTFAKKLEDKIEAKHKYQIWKMSSTTSQFVIIVDTKHLVWLMHNLELTRFCFFTCANSLDYGLYLCMFMKCQHLTTQLPYQFPDLIFKELHTQLLTYFLSDPTYEWYPDK